MPFFYLSSWLIGALKGYSDKDDNVTDSATLGILGTSFFMIPLMHEKNLMHHLNNSPFALFLGSTIVVGSLYYTGNIIGNTIRRIKDNKKP